MQIVVSVTPQLSVPRRFGQPGLQRSVCPSAEVVCCGSLPEKLFFEFKMHVSCF